MISASTRKGVASIFLQKRVYCTKPTDGPPKPPAILPNPPAPGMRQLARNGITGFAGVGVVCGVHQAHVAWDVSSSQLTCFIGSFGSSACLLAGAPTAPFSQPRNVIGGHVISSLVGLCVSSLVSGPAAIPLAVSLSLVSMQLLRVFHPPAGGTSLLMLPDQILHGLGPLGVIPVAFGSALLVACCGLLNNLSGIKYPTYW
eukprot:TRINITY_DN17820_c0_g1_i1.p1 TRINITY_DN17820_c0_g1~~TRINITY_DN17820_c0_g1_i1.p1  ORF type:complete len:201 (+),score=10.46 TRINITY_DN17820_c0_g1_i1:46-648(+)